MTEKPEVIHARKIELMGDLHSQLEYIEKSNMTRYYFDNKRGASVVRKMIGTNGDVDEKIFITELIQVEEGQGRQDGDDIRYILSPNQASVVVPEYDGVFDILHEIKNKGPITAEEMKKKEKKPESSTTNTDSTTEKEIKPTT